MIQWKRAIAAMLTLAMTLTFVQTSAFAIGNTTEMIWVQTPDATLSTEAGQAFTAKDVAQICTKSVELGSLFQLSDDFLNANVTPEISVDVTGGSYTPSDESWDKGTVSFTENSGTVAIKMNGEGAQKTTKEITIGHDLVHHDAQAATCTVIGWAAYDTCARCDYTTYAEIPALGHAWPAVNAENGIEWSWTANGADGYTATATFTCTRNCGHTSVAQDATVTSADGSGDNEGYIVYTATVNFDSKEYTDTKMVEKPAATFTHSVNLAHTDTYLYRVGNGNTVKLESLFKAESGNPNSNDVSITVEKADNSSSVTLERYEKNSSDWTQSTLKFTGEGPVTVTIKEGNGPGYSLNLEVVDGKNVTTATSATENNVVLLKDVSGGFTVSNGHTLYGNGFEVRETRTKPKGATNGLITLRGGIMDNVFVKGYEPSEAHPFISNHDETAPVLYVDGTNSQIYNCHVSGGRYAVSFYNATNAYMANSVIDGGAIACIGVQASTVTLKDCVTTVSTQGGIKGAGIHVPAAGSNHITILGKLEQHNWVQKTDLPSTYQNMFSDLFTNSTLAYTYNGAAYVNAGILFMSESEQINTDTAKAAITDSNDANYVYTTKTYMSYTGTMRSAKSESGSAAMIAPADTSTTQYGVLPTASFDYTTKNYVAKTEGSDNYCYYDSTTGRVVASCKLETADSTFDWDPDILTVQKFGNTLPCDYSISPASGWTENDGIIKFSEGNDYTITYTYTDPYNYDSNLTRGDKNYAKTVKLSVTLVEPEAVVYHPEFTYASSWSSYSAKQVQVGNDTYVMPDATSTSSTVGSTTVGGQTIYYPIVTVAGKNNNGGNYSSGKIYCFAPAFSAINIEDLDKDTGETLYTYNSSTQKWPHNISATTGPGSSQYYGPASTRDPYGAATGASYEKYAYNSNNGGLCYTSNEIEKRDVSANTKVVKFHYVGNDGVTYYYYIAYSYQAVTYVSGGCFADGTLITMADGTQKPIEQVRTTDMLRTYDFFTGEYKEQPIALIINHGDDMYPITNLHYSDGTTLRLIYDHGTFDYDLNQFVYIMPDNYEEYVGHKFAKDDGMGGYTLVTLDSVEFTEEYTGLWSITSVSAMNAILDGILTVAPPEEFYNWIEMGDKLRYDMDVFAADLATYGTYDYEVFADYVTYEEYLAFNGPYLRIPVEKGCFEFQFILDLIDEYKSYMTVNEIETVVPAPADAAPEEETNEPPVDPVEISGSEE